MIKRRRSGRTDERTRHEIQIRQASVRTIARELGISPTTVQKWRKRASTADLPMGPRTPRPLALTPADEASIVLFRWASHLSLNDCLRALAPAIPHLRRSTLYRTLKRHGLAEAPSDGNGTHGNRPPLGSFRITATELHTASGSLGLFVAMDVASRFAVVDLCLGTQPIVDLVRTLPAAVPYPVRSILWQTWPPPDGDAPAAALLSRRPSAAALAEARAFNGEEVRELSPWPNCVVPEMVRTVLAGFDTLLDRDLAESKTELDAFVADFNGRTLLHCLGGLTPTTFSLAAQSG